MTWMEFSLRLLIAFLFGGFIGLERQWRQRMAGLRTNSLVSAGSALFMMMAAMTPGDSSHGRIVAQIVSGIGFLGGGVILRDGLNVRGLNTAATLWCAAAVGCLSGLGLLHFAGIGAAAVFAANVLLRPFAQKVNRARLESGGRDILYRFRCTCRAGRVGQIRALLVQQIAPSGLVLYALHSEDREGQDQVEIRAELRSAGRRDEAVEQIATRLSAESCITAIRWEVSAALDDEDAAPIIGQIAVSGNP